MQELRKSAGLDVSDRIRLGLRVDDVDLRAAVDTHLETITAEVLATDVTFADLDAAAPHARIRDRREARHRVDPPFIR